MSVTLLAGCVFYSNPEYDIDCTYLRLIANCHTGNKLYKYRILILQFVLTRSLREPGGPCTKSMEVSESRMEGVKCVIECSSSANVTMHITSCST